MQKTELCPGEARIAPPRPVPHKKRLRPAPWGREREKVVLSAGRKCRDRRAGLNGTGRAFPFGGCATVISRVRPLRVSMACGRRAEGSAFAVSVSKKRSEKRLQKPLHLLARKGADVSQRKSGHFEQVRRARGGDP